MDYRRLGQSNLLVSRLWLGGMSLGSPKPRPWVADPETSRAILQRAIESGINVVDTSDAYGGGESEELIGRTLQELGVRDQIVIATKFGISLSPERKPNQYGYSKKYIVQQCEASLRRLRTDRIDLFQTHIWTPEARVEEVAETFDLLARQGKILYAGITDIPSWQVAKWIYLARYTGLTQLISVQHHYNATWREDEKSLIPLCRQEGVGLVAYSPLGRGFLAGPGRMTIREKVDDMTRRFYGRKEDERVQAVIGKVAQRLGQRPVAVALNWALAQPHMTSVVVGPTTVAQLDELVACTDQRPDDAAIQEISSAYGARSEIGHG